MKKLRLVLCMAALPLSGCAAAAGGAIGAGAAMAYEERGAQSYVHADIRTVAAVADAALRGLSITLEEWKLEPHENEIELKVQDGDRKIVVDIEGNRDAGRTHIEVTASKNVVDYDTSRADEILRVIIARLSAQQR